MRTTEERKDFIRSREWWTDFCEEHRLTTEALDLDITKEQAQLCRIANGHYGRSVLLSQILLNDTSMQLKWTGRSNEVDDFLGRG